MMKRPAESASLPLRALFGWLWLLAVLAVVAPLTCVGLGSFGVWDPWELSAADVARELAAGHAPEMTRAPLDAMLVGAGFEAFGVHEWSGRLPIAIAGLLVVVVAFWLAAWFVDRRAGVWAALIAGTSPLYLLNARTMMGASPEHVASALVFFCALGAVFDAGRRERYRAAATGAWLVGLLLSALLATAASGVLLGVAPPLLAAAVAAVARGRLAVGRATDVSARFVAGLVVGVAILTAASAGYAVFADHAGYSAWTGGTPRGGNPPTWEIMIERVFHSFAPWSGLLPLALAQMLGGRRDDAEPAPDAPDELALRFGVVAWVGFGFLAATMYGARLGTTTFLPLVGASVAVALLIRDVERSGRGAPAIALIGFLFTMLIARDYRAYPGGPIEGLGVDGIEIPEVFAEGTMEQQEAHRLMPPKVLALLISVFAGLLALGLAADPRAPFAGLRRSTRHLRKGISGGKARTILRSLVSYGLPLELLRRQWQRGAGFRVGLVLVFASLFLGSLAAGIFGFTLHPSGSELGGIPSTVVLLLRSLIGLPFALFGVVAVGRVVLFGVARVGKGSYRLVPVGVAAVAVAAYTAFGYQAELSQHFSPRDVYETYNELATAGEPLGEFRVGGRAAEYYATGEIEALDSQHALIEFLQRDGRVWAAFRADDLASVNRDFRRATHQHLFVADARSARMILATNQPIPGRENQNYLANTVLDEPPRIQHPTDISFDDRIELLGYDLDLPNGSSVGPGQTFAITWYFRVLAPVPGSYQPFLHIDGPGERINGDHQPVGGRYPVRLWEPGDIVVDRQELRVPPNLGRMNLTMYLGFFSGEQRLPVVRGPKDDANRAMPGVLPVR